MKFRKIFFILLIFSFVILFNNICFAKDIDQINKYYITVEPREDGTLDMLYHIEWEVLEDTSAGPLTWVQIGIPNKNVDSIKAISSNIKRAKYSSDNGAYILIDFKKEYNKGDIITFDFSFHQKYMYTLDSSYCKYSFTPGWFNDIEVKDIQVYWNAKNVESHNAGKTNSDNYLVWSGKLAKGAKIKTEIKYPRSAFASLNESQQYSNADYGTGSNDYFDNTFDGICSILVILIIIISFIAPLLGTGYNRHGGYGYGRRNYYDEYRYYHSHHHRRPPPNYSSSSSSGHNCVSSCACACACAGGGRAGCSKKDFYGTNLRTKNIEKNLNKIK